MCRNLDAAGTEEVLTCLDSILKSSTAVGCAPADNYRSVLSGTHASLDRYRVLVSPASRSCAAAKDRSRRTDNPFPAGWRTYRGRSSSVGGCHSSCWKVGHRHASIFLRAAALNIVLLARCCAAESDTGRHQTVWCVNATAGVSWRCWLAGSLARFVLLEGCSPEPGWDGVAAFL